MLKNIINMLDKLNLREPIKSISTNGYSKVGEINKIDKDIKEYYNLSKGITDSTKINKERYIINKNIDKIIVNLYTDNNQLYELVRNLFAMYLRLEKNLITNGISPDGYEVEVKCMNNDFTREFSINEDKANRKEEIEALLPKYDKKILNIALIDIPPYHNDEKTKDRDPKNLIRSVFKNNKILTQFINYTDKSNINSVMNSVKDLISASGFIEQALYKETGVKESYILIGLSKVSGGDNENILAMSKIDRGKIYINMYGIDKWVELDECIFLINKSFLEKVNIGKVDRVKRDGINQWILSNLCKVLEEGRKTYTFIDANLRNNLWKYVKNDEFKKLKLSNLRLINKEKLRLIRINNTDEVPEYFIYNTKNNNINKQSGVFKGENSTYYLVGKRHEADQTPNAATKCSSPNKALRRPSMYELSIIGYKDEKECDEIAIMAQELRKMNISYDYHASLPLPMYTINRLSEYISAEKSFK